MLSPSKFHYCTEVRKKPGRTNKYTPEEAEEVKKEQMKACKKRQKEKKLADLNRLRAKHG